MNLVKLIGRKLIRIYELQDWYLIKTDSQGYIRLVANLIIYIELEVMVGNKLQAICYSSNGKKYILGCDRVFDSQQSVQRYITYFLKPLKL